MPARDGAGWLVRLCADAPTFLIWMEASIIVCTLYLLWRKRNNRMSGEEKILLCFFCLTLLPSVSALIGFAVWFAADSVAAGIGAGISLFLSIIAFIGCGIEDPTPEEPSMNSTLNLDQNLTVVVYAHGNRLLGSRFGFDRCPQLNEVVELLERGNSKTCQHCGSVYCKTRSRKYQVVKVTAAGVDWEGLSTVYDYRAWDVIEKNPGIYDHYNLAGDLGVELWSSDFKDVSFVVLDLVALENQ